MLENTVISYIKTGHETSACLATLPQKVRLFISSIGLAPSPRLRQFTMNGHLKKLEDQNSSLRKAYIRMSKGRSMYEAERLRYKTLNAQLNQKLKELEEMEAAPYSNHTNNHTKPPHTTYYYGHEANRSNH